LSAAVVIDEAAFVKEPVQPRKMADALQKAALLAAASYLGFK
jgi:hypothetical protein